MTSKTLASKFSCKIIKIGESTKYERWAAYRGGNGTPVVDLAEAYSLETLAKRIAGKLEASR